MSQENQKPTEENSSIIIKKIKKGHGGHHGGSWKIAYADFVTAMMAFFLLMWLLISEKKATLEGIAEYFRTPLKIALSGGENVGDRTSVLKGGGKDLTRSEGQMKKGNIKDDENVSSKNKPTDNPPAQMAAIDVKEKADKADQAKLTELNAQLAKAIDANPILKEHKNQIKLEITSKGLRIQILDDKARPMFATGSSEFEPFMKDIIHQIGKVLNQVNNKISLAGHTDATPYFNGEKSYSNWELSTERANALRKELIIAGMAEDKVLKVAGFASAVPLDKNDLFSPVNRRISIIVLNKKTEDETLKEGF